MRFAEMSSGMNAKLLSIACLAAVLCAIHPALAQVGADVALVNQLAGDVLYVGSGGKENKAQAFMRVRQGDRFTVSAGGLLRIVYLQGGRQESWKGPASFVAGLAQSETVSGTGPQVALLPAAVPQKIARVPELLQSARLGGVTVRGGSRARPPLSAQDEADVAEARAIYKQMRATAAPDDVTPELYLISVLQDYSLYDELRPVAQDMRRRQPDNTGVRDLASWIDSRAAQTPK
jgi:hypothetical protein